MAWSNAQKQVIKSYQRWARVEDSEYREIMAPYCATRSSTAPGLTNFHFDRVIRELEQRLEWAVDQGLAAIPDRVQDLHFYRRLPCRTENDSAQEDLVMTLFQRLAPWLQPEDRCEEYLTRIAATAARRHCETWRGLRVWQMSAVIEALKDRLAHVHSDQKWPELATVAKEAPF